MQVSSLEQQAEELSALLGRQSGDVAAEAPSAAHEAADAAAGLAAVSRGPSRRSLDSATAYSAADQSLDPTPGGSLGPTPGASRAGSEPYTPSGSDDEGVAASTSTAHPLAVAEEPAAWPPVAAQAAAEELELEAEPGQPAAAAAEAAVPESGAAQEAQPQAADEEAEEAEEAEEDLPYPLSVDGVPELRPSPDSVPPLPPLQAREGPRELRSGSNGALDSPSRAAWDARAAAVRLLPPV